MGGNVLHGTPGRGESNDGSGGWQIPGDTNQDGDLDVADVYALRLLVFIGPSAVLLRCEGATVADGGNRSLNDIDGSDGVDINGAVALLRYRFIGGGRCRFWGSSAYASKTVGTSVCRNKIGIVVSACKSQKRF